MPLDDAASLLAVFADHDLLPKSRVAEVRALAAPFPKAANLARELARRGVLTPFQVNEIFQGRAAGLVLGQYLLLERVGAGGMGQVYKARHRVLDRLVALKVIRAEYVARPDAVERFRRECRAAARLSHPNIILVHDAHQAGDVHFLAMEFVEGKDLGRVLKERGPLPVAEACEYARQAALGLQHAHERGLVHRDVKPANLILTADGLTVKVLDLGLARLRTAPGAAEADLGLTQDGAIMGTPDYLAPEQAGGDSGTADARADVYSLGCTLYHLLAGRPPFTGETLGQKIAAHLTKEAPPLEKVRPGLPVGLPAVVRRMTAKEPAARYATAAEVAGALMPYCRTEPGGPTVSLPPAAATPMGQTLPQTPASAGRPPTEAPPGSTLPQTPSAGWAEVAPGRRVGRKLVAVAALLAVVLAGLLIWRLLPSGGPPSPGPVEAGGPRASQDAGPTPGRVDDSGKPGARAPVVPITVNLPPPPKHAAVRDHLPWPPKECVALLGDEAGRHWGDVQGAAFRPDGQVIATADHVGANTYIHLWDAKTIHERAPWMAVDAYVAELAYSPDGKLLAAACGGGVRLWDAGDDGLSNERKFPKAGPGGGPNFFHLLFSADGEWLLAWDASGEVTRWRLTKGEPEQDGEQAPAPIGRLAPLVVAADGRTAAHSRQDAGTGKYQVCVQALFEKEPNERVVELSSAAGVLALSADGKRLAAHVGALGAGLLRFWDVDNGELHARQSADLSKYGITDFPPSFCFTPDGGRVVFAVSPRAGPPALWVFDATTGDGTRLDGLDGPAACLSLPADGKAVAVGCRDHRLRLWEDRGKGFEPRAAGPAAAGLVRRLAFRPGGADLAVASRLSEKADGNTDLSNLVVWDWTKGESRQVFPCGGWFSDCAYSPDGARLFAGGQAPGKVGAGAYREGFLRVWQADALKEEPPPKLPKDLLAGPIDAVTFDHDGKALALLGGSEFTRLACVCDPWPVRVRGKPFEAPQFAESLALAPNASTAAILATRRQIEEVPVVKLWDVRDIEAGPPKEAAPANPLEGAAGQKARRLTYSPDGKSLASLAALGWFPGAARTVMIWDAATGKTRVVGDPKAKRPLQVEAFAYSPDGGLLATVETDGHVTLWRADKPAEMIREWEFPGPVTAVAFSPGGDYLAVGDGDGTVAVLKLPPLDK